MSVISETKSVVHFRLPEALLTIGGLPRDPRPPDDFQLEGIMPGVWVAAVFPEGLYLYHVGVNPRLPLVRIDVAPRFDILAIGASLWYESLAVNAFLDSAQPVSDKDPYGAWRSALTHEPILGVAFGVLFNARGLKHNLYTQTVDGAVVGIYLKQQGQR